MAEPTDAEIGGWVTIHHVADWAGLTGDATADDTPLGSLLLAFSTTAAQHFRVLGAMLKDDFTAGLRLGSLEVTYQHWFN